MEIKKDGRDSQSELYGIVSVVASLQDGLQRSPSPIFILFCTTLPTTLDRTDLCDE